MSNTKKLEELAKYAEQKGKDFALWDDAGRGGMMTAAVLAYFALAVLEKLGPAKDE